jgi:hypothetical protein
MHNLLDVSLLAHGLLDWYRVHQHVAKLLHDM